MLAVIPQNSSMPRTKETFVRLFAICILTLAIFPDNNDEHFPRRNFTFEGFFSKKSDC